MLLRCLCVCLISMGVVGVLHTDRGQTSQARKGQGHLVNLVCFSSWVIQFVFTMFCNKQGKSIYSICCWAKIKNFNNKGIDYFF